MKKKILILVFLVVISTITIMLFNNWKARDIIMQYKYDVWNENNIVTSDAEIDKIFNALEAFKLSDLDSSYLAYTKSDLPKYNRLLQKCIYYKITRDDLYKYVVNEFRIKHMMPKDKYYIELVKGERNFVYLTIRKDVLYKLLKLQKELKLMDFNYLDFDVINGYRHPLYNEKVGGAKSSWHIRGAALDIYIRDIDKNGKINKEDKKIVIDILNNKVIKNEGGIGRYPWSQVIHFDVRGYRARWDRQ